MLLQRCALCAVLQFHLALNVCYAITKQEQKALLAQHGGYDTVGRGVDIFVGLILLKVLDDYTVAVFQYPIFIFIRYFLIGIIGNKRFVLLTEHIEESLALGRATIECTLNRYTALIVVFLIVGEYHQLRNVEEAAKTCFAHSCIDAFTLSQDTLVVIWFLYFNKSQWHSIDETGDIRTEIILRIFVFTCKLCCDVPIVVFRIVKVNKFYSAIGRKHLVKLAS